ncbi:MAG: hypothetical protein JKX69_10540 [Rhodobacteraceae bacterium]|nr:hypothetical protein [Paracoccaceae bacterium]
MIVDDPRQIGMMPIIDQHSLPDGWSLGFGPLQSRDVLAAGGYSCIWPAHDDRSEQTLWRAGGRGSGRGALVINFWDEVSAHLDRANRIITLGYADGCGDAHTLEHLLSDQIAPRLMAGDGLLVLHGGAVASLSGRGAVLLGPSGAGKSTLCAALAATGMGLITDDAVGVTFAGAEAVVQGLRPGLRLLPDAADALLGPDAFGRDVAYFTDKKRFAPAAKLNNASTAPIGAVFLLCRPVTGGQRVPGRREVLCARVLGAQTCMALVENSFSLDPTDRTEAKNRLRAAAKLAAMVPVYRLSYAHDFALLPELTALVSRLTEGQK